MQRLEVSCAVRPIYGSLGAKGLTGSITKVNNFIQSTQNQLVCWWVNEIQTNDNKLRIKTAGTYTDLNESGNGFLVITLFPLSTALLLQEVVPITVSFFQISSTVLYKICCSLGTNLFFNSALLKMNKNLIFVS
jgi:hypothetical protein